MKVRPHRDWFYVNIAKLLIALSQSFQSAKPRNGQVRVRQSNADSGTQIRNRSFDFSDFYLDWRSIHFKEDARIESENPSNDLIRQTKEP